jgi:molybdate transport system substrate-binding protein
VIKRLNTELREIFQMSDVKTKLVEQGLETAGSTPEEWRASMQRTSRDGRASSKKRGLRPSSGGFETVRNLSGHARLLDWLEGVRLRRGYEAIWRVSVKAITIAAVVLGLASFAAPDYASSAEVRLISMPGMKVVLDELGPQFERASGHKLSIRYGLLPQFKDTIDAGEFDASISGGPVAAYLNQKRSLLPDSSAEIARVGIGVAVRVGTSPRPDISTVDAFKRTLLDAKSISYTNDSGAGTYIAAMLEKLGIAEELRSRTRLMGGGGQNPRAVASGEVEFGMSIISDILSVPGAEVLGPLPSELQSYTVVAVGIGTTAVDPNAARVFLKYLTTPTAAVLMNSKGFELIPK